MILTIAVVAAGVFLKVDPTSWALLALAIGIVICAELINSALERVVDLATDGEFHRLARDSKDVAAAGVLCAAVMAAIIGLLVFVPRLTAFLGWH